MERNEINLPGGTSRDSKLNTTSNIFSTRELNSSNTNKRDRFMKMGEKKISIIFSVISFLIVGMMSIVFLVLCVGMQGQFRTVEENLTETRDLLEKVIGGNTNCKDLLDSGNTANGVYTIIVNWSPVRVLCDMAGGGWTVFQHRFNGSVNFRKNFANYTRGFGDPNTEYWLGLENIHQITISGDWTLRVDLETFDGETAYAQYKDFKIGNGSRYELAVGSYSGTAGDSLTYHNGQAYSTFDMDQDEWTGVNCATDSRRNGAWWWRECGYSSLNSYSYNYTGSVRGMHWYHFKGWSTPMKTTTMKMIKFE